MGTQKNRLIETVLLSTKTYVSVEKLENDFLNMHSYLEACGYDQQSNLTSYC